MLTHKKKLTWRKIPLMAAEENPFPPPSFITDAA